MAPLILAFVAVAAALVAYFVLRPASCATSADCPPGESCSPKGRCAATGGGPGPQKCKRDSDCPGGAFCDPRGGACRPVIPVPGPGPQKCKKDSDCPKGAFCDTRGGACRPVIPVPGPGPGPQKCKKDSDCPKGAFCDARGGACRPASSCPSAGRGPTPLKLNSFLTSTGGVVSIAPTLTPGSSGFYLTVGPVPSANPFGGLCFFSPLLINNGPTFQLAVAFVNPKNKKLEPSGWVVRHPGTMNVVAAPLPANGEGADWLYDPATGLLSDPARTFTVKAVSCGGGGGDPQCAALAPYYPGAPFSRLGLEPYNLADCLSANHTWNFWAP